MKNINRFKIILTFFILLQSCNSDDNSSNSSNDLIGKWVRVDSNSNFENELTFNEDYSGVKIYLERDGEQVISSAIDFDWNVSNNQLTIALLDEDITSSFSFDDDGHLIIDEISEIPYAKED